MDFWQEIERQLNEYYKSHCSIALDNILFSIQPYLSKKAHLAKREAQMSGVYIPYEDFYSNYLLSTWQALEDYKDINDKNFKTVLGRRLYFSKCEAWRGYKKKSADARDKDGITYVSGRWDSIDELSNTFGEISQTNDYFHLNEVLTKYYQENPINCRFISMLIRGFSPAEAVMQLGICKKYDASARKKVQRIRESFRRFLEDNHFEII